MTYLGWKYPPPRTAVTRSCSSLAIPECVRRDNNDVARASVVRLSDHPHTFPQKSFSPTTYIQHTISPNACGMVETNCENVDSDVTRNCFMHFICLRDCETTTAIHTTRALGDPRSNPAVTWPEPCPSCFMHGVFVVWNGPPNFLST